MVRSIVGQSLDHDPDFRWRGEAVTRIENLSDIVFALALGMLISGVDTPRNLTELNSFLFSIIPTAAGFAVLLGLWHAHYTFFRRYGVADQRIIILNAVLIFVILFMAYPLRFGFDSLYGVIISSLTGDFSRNVDMGIMSFADSGTVVGYFAVSYAAVFAILALMLGHVLRNKDQLKLNAYELAKTHQLRFARWGECLVAMLVAIISLMTPLYSIGSSLYILLFLPFIIARRLYPAIRTELPPSKSYL
ncbi:TMEM175 family protein [Litorimonas sp. RW-G-Af-16]|uniref:TMEM175 family protein n=1 Tax=Litorimonas sp. RW-G-Af-16 TaxID=3241168 RepID=UPI00390C8B8A